MPRLSDSMEEGTIVRWLKQRRRAWCRRASRSPRSRPTRRRSTFDADADGTLRILVGEGETVRARRP